MHSRFTVIIYICFSGLNNPMDPVALQGTSKYKTLDAAQKYKVKLTLLEIRTCIKPSGIERTKSSTQGILLAAKVNVAPKN